MEASIYRLRHKDILALCVLALLALGVIMVQSAAANVTDEVQWQWTRLGTLHLIYVGVALLVFFGVGFSDYAKLGRRQIHWKNPAILILAIAAITCVAALIPYVGHEVNGARRWIRIGPVQFQPSELAKWATVLFLAWWLTTRPVNLDSFFRGFLLTLVPVGVLCLLVVKEDFGTAALIGLVAFTMLLASRIKWWHLAVVIPPALIAGFIAIHGLHGDSYRWRRMTAFLDPYAAPQREGYHMIQSLLGFTSGGFFGKGLGNGIQKLGYLPEDTTDFIFTTICEELGFFGAMLVIVFYLGIIFVGWQVIKQKRDSFGRMLAFGVTAMIGFQAAINIAVATVSVPTKGLSLPLVSAGGSGLVITCAALGLLYSVTRFEHEDELEASAPILSSGEPLAIVQRLWGRLTQQA